MNEILPFLRLSCLPILILIINPHLKNNNALKIAWQTMWKNPHFNSIIEIQYIINPNCLKVDIAITFLKSISVHATNPDNKQVINEIFIKKKDSLIKFMGKKNRNIKYTPAVTKVDEWTKDETGVGAAIAAGNHAENGICALLVMAVKMINIIKIE